ncbi:MAG: U32 family peptidase [Pseudobutyrivibrio sp.]|nr:U32 family peptidase [Pseudobutyrivibrio sp.]
MNQLELLSPAGDLEIFKAVVNAGADAVYFGGDLFGARAYAKNFSIEEAKAAIDYAHIHGAKAYLTVNTLLKNTEIEKNLYEYLRKYVENGIDAFIVQDMGVFSFIRNYFPNTHIHVSTQMSTCTEFGAKLLSDMGASRVVTAREISLEEISDIHKTCPDLEIESFVHGALCVCYSGQCLMSSMIGGRSGNRGRCAQPCRLPYEAYMDGNHINKKGSFILSPKDFCTIEQLPEMIEAGVMSFKIEGRMKQLEYATGVVSVYRHYLDEYIYRGARNYSVKEEDIQKLLDFGNRSGFTNLYLTKHNGPEMMTFEAPSHTKKESSPVDYSEKKIKVDCTVSALLGKEFSIVFTDSEGRVGAFTGGEVQPAQKKAATKEDIERAVSGLGNTSFEIDHLNIDYDDGIFLPVSMIKNARRSAIMNLENSIMNSKTPTVNEFQELPSKKNFTSSNNCFVTVSTAEQLKAVAEFDFVNRVAVPQKLFEEAYGLLNGKEIYIYLPIVLRKDYKHKINIDERAAGVIAASMDELGLLSDMGYPKENIILDHRIYTFNNRSLDFFEQHGYTYNCIPYELSLKELNHRNNQNSQMIVYSRIPMMVTANCTVKNTVGCRKNNDTITFVDRKNQNMIVSCNCDYCYNVIYNSKKYIAFDMKNQLDNLGVKEYRIDFTVESAKETKNVLEGFNTVFNKNGSFELDEDFTRGHLKRGVE